MQPTTDLQKPDGLAVLQQLLSVPQEEFTEEQLVQSGLAIEEARSIITLRSRFIKADQLIAFYTDKSNEPILKKQQENQLKMQDHIAASGKQTMELITQLKESLINNANGTLGAFNRVLLIYTVAFIVGILLVITAVVFAAMGKTILAIAFGTIGLIDMVTYFFKMPASEIQKSRSNLSQLQVVLLVWLKDFVNNDRLSGIYIEKVQSIEAYKTLADANIENTEKLLKMIQELAEPKD